MRITQVVASDQLHCTERHVVEAANGLCARGHAVTVVGGEPDATRGLLAPGIVHQDGHDARSALASPVRAVEQDVVHAHLSGSEHVATLAAPANRCRRVVTEHQHPHDTPAARVQRLALRLAPTSRLAVSAKIAATAPAGTSVLLIGVRNQGNVPPLDGSGGQPPTVLAAQRLHPAKDTATAVRPWALSGLGQQGWRLRIAGQGREVAALQTLSHEPGVQRSVELLGWRSYVHALMESAQVFLAPARLDPLGLSVLEAMSRSVPVTASRATGHLETMGSIDAARLFAVGVAAAAASLLLQAADDPAGRPRYGTALRDVQREHFDHEIHLAALERVYAR